MIEQPFMLGDADRRNPLWLRLSDYFEKRLKELRGKNDGPLDQMETASLRGEIRCLKNIISLGDMPPIMDGEQYGPR